MGERREWLGKRAKLAFERQRLEVTCEALRDFLQRILPPHGPIDELDGKKIANAATDLHTRLEDLAEIRRKMDIVDRVLLHEEETTGALRDLVLNNTRAIEHLTSAIQANFYCPAAWEAATGKK